MGRERTLLERIAATADGGRLEPSLQEDWDALLDSVRHNLQRVFRSHHGMSQAAPDYGLPAATDLFVNSPTLVARVQEALRVAVEKYEPRLRQVRVSHRANEESPRTLSFALEATLVGRSAQHRVSFEASFAGDGQLEVRD